MVCTEYNLIVFSLCESPITTVFTCTGHWPDPFKLNLSHTKFVKCEEETIDWRVENQPMYWCSFRCFSEVVVVVSVVLGGRIARFSSCDQLSRCSVVSAATYWTILAHPGETTRIFEGYNGLVYGVSLQQYRLLSHWILAQYDVSVIAVSWGPKVGLLFTETTSPKVGPSAAMAAPKAESRISSSRCFEVRKSDWLIFTKTIRPQVGPRDRGRYKPRTVHTGYALTV